jgi:hypothetical protein
MVEQWFDPDRYSSSYGSHFLIRQCITLPASGRPCQARPKTEAEPAGLLGSLSSVRIYGHYPMIDDKRTTFYRHPIHEFSFAALDGKGKWTAYKFTKNVYDLWMPTHFERLCSVINTLPAGLDFELSQQSELRFPEESGLSQELEGHRLLPQSNADSASLREHDKSVKPC